MIKVTLDTNVLVSGTFWTGDPYRILDLIDQKRVCCVLSKEVISEYRKTVNSREIMGDILPTLKSWILRMGLPTTELVEGFVVIVPDSSAILATDCSVVEALSPQAYRFWAVRPYHFEY